MTQNHNKFGLKAEDTQHMVDLPQTYNLGKLEMGKTVQFLMSDAEPREVEFMDSKTGKAKKELVLNGKNLSDNLNYGLWLTAKSLKMEFLKVYEKFGTLKGVKVTIGKREYPHEKYGKVIAYTVQGTKE